MTLRRSELAANIVRHQVRAARAAEDAAYCLYRQVLLGFVPEGDGARWLTNDEISAGVLAAIDEDTALFRIGVTRPWSLRPS